MKNIIQSVIKNAAIGTIGSFALLGEFTFFTVVPAVYATFTKGAPVTKGAVKATSQSVSWSLSSTIIGYLKTGDKELIASAYNSAKITGATALFAVVAYGAYKWAYKDGEYVWVHKDDLQKVTDVLGDSHNGEGHPE